MSEAYDRLAGVKRAHPPDVPVDLFYCRACGAIVGSKDKHELMVHEKMAPSTMADILAKVDEVLEASEAAWGEFPIVGNDYPLGKIVKLLSELRGLRGRSEERPKPRRNPTHAPACRCNECLGAPAGLPSEDVWWANLQPPQSYGPMPNQRTKEDRP